MNAPRARYGLALESDGFSSRLTELPGSPRSGEQILIAASRLSIP